MRVTAPVHRVPRSRACTYRGRRPAWCSSTQSQNLGGKLRSARHGRCDHGRMSMFHASILARNRFIHRNIAYILGTLCTATSAAPRAPSNGGGQRQ